MHWFTEKILCFLGELNSHEPTRITNTGGQAFFAIFAHPSCSIKDLFLHNFPLGNEFVTHLGDALAVNQTMRYLHIGVSLTFTLVGWKSCNMFEKSQLCIGRTKFSGMWIDSCCITVILAALAGNLTLKRLNIIKADIVENADIISHLPCDKMSIDRTYLLNYAMTSIHLPFYRVPVPGISS